MLQNYINRYPYWLLLPKLKYTNLVSSLFLYKCEWCTVEKIGRKKIDTFDTYCRRWLLIVWEKNPFSNLPTNPNREKTTFAPVADNISHFFGDVYRLKRSTVESRILGKNSYRRSATRQSVLITQVTGKAPSQLTKLPEARGKWRLTVQRISRSHDAWK